MSWLISKIRTSDVGVQLPGSFKVAFTIQFIVSVLIIVHFFLIPATAVLSPVTAAIPIHRNIILLTKNSWQYRSSLEENVGIEDEGYSDERSEYPSENTTNVLHPP